MTLRGLAGFRGCRAFRAFRALAVALGMLASCTALPASTRADEDFAEPPAPARLTEVRYEGVLDLAGHYKRPGDTRRFRSVQRFVANDHGALRLDWTTGAEGDSAGAPETWIVVRDSVYHRDSPGSAWQLLAGERAALAKFQAQAGFPASWQDSVTRGKPGGAGLTVNRADGRVVWVAYRFAHPRLGDVTNSVEYFARATSAEPESMHVTVYERDHSWTLYARRLPGSTDVFEDSVLTRPATFDPPPPEAATPVRVERLADGVWSVDQDNVDSRSLVVEFADYVAVIEAAVGSANGERLVDSVRARFPKKPIRYALFSHHHPHYTGGLRALIAEGATVVTTPGNEAFVREVAAYPFRIAPDRLARKPRPLRLQTFTGRFELADKANRLVAVDIGERSTHTDEFVVFWLPQQSLVFETEQGWVTVDGKLRAARRAEGFLKVLADEGIAADWLVQSWPMRGNRAEVSRAELEELVRERNAAGR